MADLNLYRVSWAVAGSEDIEVSEVRAPSLEAARQAVQYLKKSGIRILDIDVVGGPDSAGAEANAKPPTRPNPPRVARRERKKHE